MSSTANRKGRWQSVSRNNDIRSKSLPSRTSQGQTSYLIATCWEWNTIHSRISSSHVSSRPSRGASQRSSISLREPRKPVGKVYLPKTIRYRFICNASVPSEICIPEDVPVQCVTLYVKQHTRSGPHAVWVIVCPEQSESIGPRRFEGRDRDESLHFIAYVDVAEVTCDGVSKQVFFVRVMHKRDRPLESRMVGVQRTSLCISSEPKEKLVHVEGTQRSAICYRTELSCYVGEAKGEVRRLLTSEAQLT